jgi:hypothetical protein
VPCVRAREEGCSLPPHLSFGGGTAAPQGWPRGQERPLLGPLLGLPALSPVWPRPRPAQRAGPRREGASTPHPPATGLNHVRRHAQGHVRAPSWQREPVQVDVAVRRSTCTGGWRRRRGGEGAPWTALPGASTRHPAPPSSCRRRTRHTAAAEPQGAPHDHGRRDMQAMAPSSGDADTVHAPHWNENEEFKALHCKKGTCEMMCGQSS